MSSGYSRLSSLRLLYSKWGTKKRFKSQLISICLPHKYQQSTTLVTVCGPFYCLQLHLLILLYLLCTEVNWHYELFCFFISRINNTKKKPQTNHFYSYCRYCFYLSYERVYLRADERVRLFNFLVMVRLKQRKSFPSINCLSLSLWPFKPNASHSGFKLLLNKQPLSTK